MENSQMELKLPNLNEKQLHEIIQEKLKGKEYVVNIEPGSAKGDNYIGIVFRIKVYLKEDHINNNNNNNNLIDFTEKKDANVLSIIVKLPPENEIRRKQFFARATFLREAFIYNKILPLYEQFQKEKGINPINDDGFHEYPKCFRAETDDNYEAIFMQDLQPLGFTMFNRQEHITYDYVALVMKLLGKLHALSFAMKDQCPERLQEVMELKDILLERNDDKALLEYAKQLKDRALETLCPKEDKIYIDKLNAYYDGAGDFFQQMATLVDGQKAEPYAALCHGDCWNNNILFYIKDGKVTKATLIDWQISRYATPVCDIMYYIFCCTTKSLRDKHYKDFLNIYYTQLSSFLTRLGSDPEKVFPRRALEDQLLQFGAFGYLMATMLLPVITTNASDVPDLDDLSEKLEAGNIDGDAFNAESTAHVYKERMRDVIVDMVELGYM